MLESMVATLEETHLIFSSGPLEEHFNLLLITKGIDVYELAVCVLTPESVVENCTPLLTVCRAYAELLCVI
jgi:hypothetical protein